MKTKSPATGPAFPHLVIRASAGSGKTYQLSNRFLALLFAGVPPERILATTFTRKAAGEIFDRILWRLAEAATDANKCAELAEATGQAKLSQLLVRALLARLLREMHQLRIGTLDSFFIQIAGSFSLELGLPPGWTIAETTDDVRLREEAVEAVLGSDRSADLVTLFHLLTKGEARRGISQLVLSTVSGLYDLYRETTPDAWRKLDCKKPLSKETLADLLGELQSFDLSDSKSQAKAREEDLQRALDENWKDLLAKGICGKVHLGESAFNRKPIAPELADLYRRLIRHVEGILVGQLIQQTEATHRLLEKFDAEYRQLKLARGLLRFDEITHSLAAAIASLASSETLPLRLDGQIEHLLLDEFQDTALPQWQVLRPLAQRITSEPAATSFFCVGDVKQAIYGWRGGLAEMFEALGGELTGLTPDELTCSYRSSQQVIDVVNQVFTKMQDHPNLGAYEPAVRKFSSDFPQHSTAKTDLRGHVTLQTAPLPREDESDEDSVCAYAAGQIAALAARAPARTIGVLCRSNKIVARMIYELRLRHAPASEEGGNPLTDSAAVEIILSLLRMGDHPGDSVAGFHLASSPLGPLVGLPDFRDGDAAARLSRDVRRKLLEEGYGPAVYHWSRLLAPHCDRRDLSRLQQLVELAYDYQPRSTLRTDDFLELVEQERMSDPTAANVRVMTVHQAKGLEFDAVFLPELDTRIFAQPPAFVAGRPGAMQPVDRVCRYAGEEVQRLLPPDWQQLFTDDQQRKVRETLCTLYVALTRAIHAMHMIIPPTPSEKSVPKTCAGLLRAALAPNEKPEPGKILYEIGSADWWAGLARREAESLACNASTSPAEQAPPAISLAPPPKARSRGLERVSPSSLEGGTQVTLSSVFAARQNSGGMEYGTLIHAWFEAIAWLDDEAPSDATLMALAAAKASEIGGLAADLPARLKEFRRMLSGKSLASLLSRRYFETPANLGLPPQLAKAWPGPTSLSLEVEREWPFALREEDRLLGGNMDRIVFVRSEGKLIAADIVDYKTDAILDGDQRLLSERTEYYRPQIEAYKRAAARLTGLPVECITARLAFVSCDRIVPV